MDKIEITPELLADLKAKAEKATPGPWEAVSCSIFSPVHRNVQYVLGGFNDYDDEENDRFAFGYNNTEFVAAANPAVVLGLITHIESLEKENRDYARFYKDVTKSMELHSKIIRIVCDALDRDTKLEMKQANEERITELKRREQNVTGALYGLYAEAHTRAERLEKEADWLVEQILCCTDDNRVDTCNYVECASWCRGATIESWREAARKAGEEKCKNN